MPRASTILVTGAAGFIGSHLCQRLLGMGVAVIGLDNFDPFYARSAKERNLAEVQAAAPAGAFEFAPVDLTDASAMQTLLARTRPEGIIHLAAMAGVRPSLIDPAGYAHANVTGTTVVLSEAAKAGVHRVVAASSSSVYGNCPTAPFHEELDVSQPISPYAATKRACELLAYTHWKLTGMPTAMLRFFTVYGPRQRPDLAVSQFLKRVSTGEPITLFGDGSMSRDYTFVDDIVTGILAAYDHIDQHGFRIWNLGGNNPVSLGEMVGTIEAAVGRKAVTKNAPMQPGDVLRTWADLTRAKAELSYRPATPFSEGVARQWAWQRVHG